jgi:hypothetical protein
MVNGHRIDRLKPKSNSNNRVPKMEILELLAATSEEFSGVFLLSDASGGKMQRSLPVSIKYLTRVRLSCKKRRRVLGHIISVAATE